MNTCPTCHHAIEDDPALSCCSQCGAALNVMAESPSSSRRAIAANESSADATRSDALSALVTWNCEQPIPGLLEPPRNPPTRHSLSDERSTLISDVLPASVDFGPASPPWPSEPPPVSDTGTAENILHTVVNRTAENVDRVDSDTSKTFVPPSAAAPIAPGQLVEMWRGAHSPTTGPSTTIRQPEQIAGSPRDSRLIITSRSVLPTQSALRSSADYELIETIGEGGVGVVYAARQASIDRTVAVKMLKPASAQKPEQRDKFLSEAVVTGDLDHPNIVPIYDLGTNESGALFYAMKRVQGTPWVSVLNQKSLPENLEILLKVVDAVGFAHSRGVIHRDLKPENVMLGEYGEVLVMDWGLALATPDFRKAKTVPPSTSMGGTPAYMAPEMATGPVTRISKASDIYLLGAILYEIVTGHPPHTAKTINACLLAAARNEIHPAEQRSELVEIALRAMATAPEDRYASAREFQAAIRKYQAHSESIVLSTRATDDLAAAKRADDYELFSRAVFAFQEAYALWDQNLVAKEGISQAKLAYAQSAFEKGDYDLAVSLLEPTDARHVSLIEVVAAAQHDRAMRQQRLKKIKRVALGLAAAMLIVVSGALVWVSHLYGVAETEAEIAKQQKQQANIQRAKAELASEEAVLAKNEEAYAGYIAKIGLAAAKVEENAFGEVFQLLEECPPKLRNWEWGRLKFLCGRALRTFTAPGPIDSVCFDRSGRRFATAGWDGKVRIWGVDNDQPLLELAYGDQYVFAVAFSPDGQRLAAAGGDAHGGYVKVWDSNTGRLLQVFNGHSDRVLSVRFNATGTQLLTASCDKTARLWNADSGELLRMFSGHSWWVWSAAFSPDEQWIVTAGQDRKCIIWSLTDEKDPTPQELRIFAGHEGPVYSAVFSPDGRDVISAGYDRRVLIWPREEARPFEFEGVSSGAQAAKPKSRVLEGHEQPVRCIRLTHSGPLRILTASHDNTLKLWDYATGKLIQTFRGHSGWVRGCDVSPDGQLAISGSQDRAVKLWNLEGYEEARVINARVLTGHGDAITSAVFSQNGEWILTSSRDRTARIWDFASGRLAKSFSEGHEFLASTAILFHDGRRFLTSGIDNTVRIWDLESGVEMAVLAGTGGRGIVALSPDDAEILTANGNAAALWDLRTGQKQQTYIDENGDVTALAFAPDGRSVFTGSATGRTTLWDRRSGKPIWSKRAHTGAINAAVFTPDGNRILTASNDNTVGQFQASTGDDLVQESLKHDTPVTAVAITSDGQRAITNANDGTVRIWILNERRVEHELTGLAGLASSLSISADGNRLITVVPKPANRDDADGERDKSAIIQIWNLATGEENAEARMRLPMVWSAVFAPAAGQVLLVGGDWAQLYPIGGDRAAMTFSPHTSVTSARFSPEMSRIVTSGGEAAVKIWDVESEKAVLKFALQHEGPINSAVYSPDGEFILTACDDRTARLWQAGDGQLVRVFEGEQGHTERIRAAVFSPAGNRIVTVSDDKSARVWQTTGELLTVLMGHKWPVTSAAFSPGRDRVVTGSEDTTARVWDSSTGKLVGELAGHTAAVNSVAYSPDGLRILTGSRDSSAKLWDAVTMKEILTLKGHTAEVTSVSFSADGRYALTGSADGTSIVWLTEEWRDQSNQQAAHP